ncbi:hypothetical protein DFR28_1127 [Arenicella xantha]|uniref:Uncharacterized protein n=1 Tax=Arenicella xantha TaxID=644221 RepID=A0A395JEJ4_9GAMM|nr:hypothetical protein DFR28_1127 [Arenicella xantha]
MIKFLKSFVSIIILVCVFLPISQCTYKSPPVISESGEVLKQSEDAVESHVISDIILKSNDPISITDLAFVLLFFLPLFLSLLPSFKGWKIIFKLSLQSILSVWLVYCSYMIVFELFSPLPAGWALSVSCILFFVLTSVEWWQMKHNKNKNLHSLRSRGRA